MSVDTDEPELVKLTNELAAQISTAQLRLDGSRQKLSSEKSQCQSEGMQLTAQLQQLHQLQNELAARQAKLAELQQQVTLGRAARDAQQEELLQLQLKAMDDRQRVQHLEKMLDKLTEQTGAHEQRWQTAMEECSDAEEQKRLQKRSAELETRLRQLQQELRGGTALTRAQQTKLEARHRLEQLENQLRQKADREHQLEARTEQLCQAGETIRAVMAEGRQQLEEKLKEARHRQRQENERLNTLEVRTARLKEQTDHWQKGIGTTC